MPAQPCVRPRFESNAGVISINDSMRNASPPTAALDGVMADGLVAVTQETWQVRSRCSEGMGILLARLAVNCSVIRAPACCVHQT